MTTYENALMQHSEGETRQIHKESYNRRRETLISKSIPPPVTSTYQSNMAIQTGRARKKYEARSRRDKTAPNVRAAR